MSPGTARVSDHRSSAHKPTARATSWDGRFADATTSAIRSGRSSGSARTARDYFFCACSRVATDPGDGGCAMRSSALLVAGLRAAEADELGPGRARPGQEHRRMHRACENHIARLQVLAVLQEL